MNAARRHRAKPMIHEKFDDRFIRMCRVILAARAAGGSLRAIARMLGLSKSGLHRLLSHMGQLEALDPLFSKAIRDELVPNGTADSPPDPDAIAPFMRSAMEDAP